jgi:hypothetical protein
MANQNFKNHVRYYTLHHFIFYPLLLIALTLSVIAYDHHPELKEVWISVIAIFVFIGWASFMMRQHYGLGNQDRIIRLELRFRYFTLTGKKMDHMEANLSFRQLAALRFASDEELPALMERASKEKLSSRDIKASIVNWLPDHMRV